MPGTNITLPSGGITLAAAAMRAGRDYHWLLRRLQRRAFAGGRTEAGNYWVNASALDAFILSQHQDATPHTNGAVVTAPSAD